MQLFKNMFKCLKMSCNFCCYDVTSTGDFGEKKKKISHLLLPVSFESHQPTNSY